MNKVTTKTTEKTTGSTSKKTTGGYTIKPLQKEHMQSLAELFIKTFCDDEPITKHLDIKYHEYEPFALAVIQKAVKDGLSVVAVDDNNKVIACAIGEDIVDTFRPEIAFYPKNETHFCLD